VAGIEASSEENMAFLEILPLAIKATKNGSTMSNLPGESFGMKGASLSVPAQFLHFLLQSSKLFCWLSPPLWCGGIYCGFASKWSMAFWSPYSANRLAPLPSGTEPFSFNNSILEKS